MKDLTPGDAVHFRILDNTPQAKEVVDITLPIDANNLDAKIWGPQLANQIPSSIAKVGEKDGNDIVFNTADPQVNSVFVQVKGYSKAMAIVEAGGGEYPAYVPNKSPPYKPGDVVSNKGANYVCKPYPNSGWCSQSPSYYEPGVGSEWTDAWDKKD
ncbi:hypothetical protein [Pseudomonas salmasensis]|uniref:hypothetical protein n=1 Tax=Pseudomonas salmasensis TaxID=2745514 RepID=UPI0021F29265|nr:hypothetical protein [Pseudomonas salmasensis]